MSVADWEATVYYTVTCLDYLNDTADECLSFLFILSEYLNSPKKKEMIFLVFTMCDRQKIMGDEWII